MGRTQKTKSHHAPTVGTWGAHKKQKATMRPRLGRGARTKNKKPPRAHGWVVERAQKTKSHHAPTVESWSAHKKQKATTRPRLGRGARTILQSCLCISLYLCIHLSFKKSQRLPTPHNLTS